MFLPFDIFALLVPPSQFAPFSPVHLFAPIFLPPTKNQNASLVTVGNRW
jgi:hypothetical protein